MEEAKTHSSRAILTRRREFEGARARELGSARLGNGKAGNEIAVGESRSPACGFGRIRSSIDVFNERPCELRCRITSMNVCTCGDAHAAPDAGRGEVFRDAREKNQEEENGGKGGRETERESRGENFAGHRERFRERATRHRYRVSTSLGNCSSTDPARAAEFPSASLRTRRASGPRAFSGIYHENFTFTRVSAYILRTMSD